MITCKSVHNDSVQSAHMHDVTRATRGQVGSFFADSGASKAGSCSACLTFSEGTPSIFAH
jgi:hypothetical protein